MILAMNTWHHARDTFQDGTPVYARAYVSRYRDQFTGEIRFRFDRSEPHRFDWLDYRTEERAMRAFREFTARHDVDPDWLRDTSGGHC